MLIERPALSYTVVAGNQRFMRHFSREVTTDHGAQLSTRSVTQARFSVLIIAELPHVYSGLVKISKMIYHII